MPEEELKIMDEPVKERTGAELVESTEDYGVDEEKMAKEESEED